MKFACLKATVNVALRSRPGAHHRLTIRTHVAFISFKSLLCLVCYGQAARENFMGRVTFGIKTDDMSVEWGLSVKS